MTVTGTADTHTEYSPGLAALGFMTSMALPALPAVRGLLTEGAGETEGASAGDVYEVR